MNTFAEDRDMSAYMCDYAEEFKPHELNRIVDDSRGPFWTFPVSGDHLTLKRSEP